jgi:hypothetical protein
MSRAEKAVLAAGALAAFATIIVVCALATLVIL